MASFSQCVSFSLCVYFLCVFVVCVLLLQVYWDLLGDVSASPYACQGESHRPRGRTWDTARVWRSITHNSSATGWPRPIGCFKVAGPSPQESNQLLGSFAEKELCRWGILRMIATLDQTLLQLSLRNSWFCDVLRPDGTVAEEPRRYTNE